MTPNDVNPSSAREWRQTIACAAAVALALKIVLALRTYGTNDVYRFEQFSTWSSALGVLIYKAAFDFNHPPTIIDALRTMSWLARVTGMPFHFLLHLPSILADTGSVWLVWKLMGNRVTQRSTGVALLFLALAPVTIMVSGFHGNSD